MMITEFYTQTEYCHLFARLYSKHSDTLLVFLHGCGDSHLNYCDFAHSSQLKNYDIFIPDLLGHGKSGHLKTTPFSFELGTQGIIKQIQSLERQYDNLFLIAHSQGGIYANQLAKSELAPLIKGVYAIETTVTQHGIFISKEVAQCINQGGDFTLWYTDFCQRIYQAGLSERAMQRYFCGLQLVDQSCFIKQCLLTQSLAYAIPRQTFTSQIGEDFRKLAIPKLYCLADKGKKRINLPFLEQNNIPTFMMKHTDSHFCAQQQPDIFVTHLNQWIANLI
ncbi:alpha/beta hydrolase [uncultured Shewanella sp.]|uniref:alpha/beta fold hydrolase n=1 Tax=uncultured Shewanella sp. TaxID=173975 RepID=UPI0026057705|nr:alpha/beta hydrolase [uncultured Shewanella sp.]